MAPRFPDVTGALIAGGRATRLGGMAKGLLEVEGEPIAARSLRLFGGLLGGSLVVANDPGPLGALGVPVVADRIPGKGAPGGLHAALGAAGTPWVLTAACDMPFLTATAISLLCAHRQGARAVLPRWRGQFEPLFALWSRACLPEVEAALLAGDPSLHDLATSLGARIVEESEWRMIDPEGRCFENANTPEDVARLGLRR
jgi:molybdopterin-guanine dinucleotide biosynthesis protein A